MPKLEHNCDNDQIEIRVPKCAVDGPIGVGNFDPDVTPPHECRSVDTSTHHVFRFNKYQCGTINSQNSVQNLYFNVITMWIENPKEDSTGSSIITRGSWYEIDSTCTTEKYFDTEGEYNPEDTTTTITTEEGFGEIKITLEYYKDKTFQEAYSPYDYPLDYEVGSTIYFAIEAESEKTNVELFTEQCVAQPEPRPAGAEDYIMLYNGCIIDPTMQCYQSSNPMINQFSIQAFRFNYETQGVSENTNVLMKCSVLVCVQNDRSSRCYKGCIGGTYSANSTNSKSASTFCGSTYKEAHSSSYSSSIEKPDINEVEPRYIQTRLLKLDDPNI
uniref:ZP domain-containing protein n=2 Tax=Ciona intestinalis TaxID=7719 RepID=F6ZAF3_CIOIN